MTGNNTENRSHPALSTARTGLRLLAGVSLLLSSSLAFATPLYDGLVAYWSFSGDASDVSGNGFDATVHDASLVADRFGNPDSAFAFGRGTYLSVTPDDRLRITGPMTINAWVNYRSLPGNPRVLSFGPDYNGFELWVGGGAWGTTPDQAVAFIGDRGISSGTERLSANEWHMLTVVSVPGTSGRMEFWLDGMLVNSAASGPGAFNYFGELNIGRKARPSYDAWNGFLDDIMIYERALTGSEIEELYSLTASLPPPAASSGTHGLPVPATLPLVTLAAALAVRFSRKAPRDADPA